VLSELAAVVTAALRVPWARAEAGGLHGECGVLPPDGSPVSVPLMAGSDPIGLLHAAARPGRTLNGDDQVLLAALGRHGGLAVRTAMLAEGLRAGREKLLAVRAEEQSRLRRDLHDDLGPTLAALSMQLDALGPLLAREPRLAAMELERLHRVSLEAMEQVRRLSRGLRPPALDQLGLVEGLRQLGAELGLDLTIDDDEVIGLPAAVEVAAYYIAREALSNVARHSGSPTATLRLEADDNAVTVIVADHGLGAVSSRPNGVGRSAMRERAEELGGRLVITSVPGAGTTVVAVLPFTTIPIGTLT
jgi:two-component system NarL family sensor kinase